MFKDNSRFSSLVEDSTGNKKSVFGKKKDEKKNVSVDEKKEEPRPQTDSYNFFKNDTPVRDNYRRPYGRERDKEFMEMIQKREQLRVEAEEKRKEEETKIALSMESFPELVKINTSKIISTTDFMKKLKSNVKVVEPVKHEVKPGWTELTRDSVTKQTIMTSSIVAKPLPIFEQDLVYEVFEGLANLHEKRTAEYIDRWGEDEWERMFLFQNYDYYYFEKLDEIYEKNNPDSEDEYDSFLEEDDEYWKSY